MKKTDILDKLNNIYYSKLRESDDKEIKKLLKTIEDTIIYLNESIDLQIKLFMKEKTVYMNPDDPNEQYMIIHNNLYSKVSETDAWRPCHSVKLVSLRGTDLGKLVEVKERDK